MGRAGSSRKVGLGSRVHSAHAKSTVDNTAGPLRCEQTPSVGQACTHRYARAVAGFAARLPHMDGCAAPLCLWIALLLLQAGDGRRTGGQVVSKQVGGRCGPVRRVQVCWTPRQEGRGHSCTSSLEADLVLPALCVCNCHVLDSKLAQPAGALRTLSVSVWPSGGSASFGNAT